MQQETHARGNESPSYWQATAPAFTQSSPLPTHTDVAVIGGGLLGTATSYWLAKAGIPVLLLERTRPAAGATGRNGGVITVGPAEAYHQAVARIGRETARAILRVTLESRALLRQVLTDEAISCDYREPGHLRIALDNKQLSNFRQMQEALEQDGIPATIVTPEDMQHFIHTPLGPRIQGGLFIPHMALAHSAKLVQGLVTAAQRYGAQVAIATVQQLQPESKGIRISTTQGTTYAGNVIVATNAWLSDLLPSLKPLITPVRGQVLAYHPIPPLFSTGLSVHLSETGEYWQQTPSGTILLGGCRTSAEGHDVGIRESQPTPEVQQALEGVLPQLLPQLPELHVAHRWAGLMAFTLDLLPIVDRAPDFPHTWFVGGFCGHGMPFGLRFGQLLAEAVIQNTVPTALIPFRLARLIAV